MKTSGRIAFVLVVMGLIVAAKSFGLFALVSDPEKLRGALLGTGATGILAFVLLYTVVQPWGIPGTLFLIAAPLIWPWPIAYLAMMAGTMGASLVGFSFARFLARDWVRARVPERFLRYEAPLARRPFWTVFWLRFVFWMPQPLHAFFGISSVSSANHFWGSLFGYALPLFLSAYFGSAFFKAMRDMPLWAWITVGLAVAIASILFTRPRRDLRERANARSSTIKRS